MRWSEAVGWWRWWWRKQGAGRRRGCWEGGGLMVGVVVEEEVKGRGLGGVLVGGAGGRLPPGMLGEVLVVVELAVRLRE